MEILIFILICYGASNILVFGSIFEGFRDLLKRLGTGPKSLHKLFSCMMCMPTWIGFGVSALFIFNGYSNLSPLTSIGVDIQWLAIILDGILASGCVWLIHTLQEHFES